MLSKTNNVTYANGIDLLSQENQDCYNQHDQQLITCKYDGGQGYYNRSDQQFITRKHNGGLEQVNTELVPAIVLKEREEWIYQWADNYDVWDNNPFTPTKGNDMRDSHTFNVDTSVFNLTKTKHNGKSKTKIVSGVSTSPNKSDFCIGEL